MRPAPKIKSEEGRKKASETTSAPLQPAAFHPISVASVEPGPGAAREIAKRSANSLAVIQPWTMTA